MIPSFFCIYLVCFAVWCLLSSFRQSQCFSIFLMTLYLVLFKLNSVQLRYLSWTVRRYVEFLLMMILFCLLEEVQHMLRCRILCFSVHSYFILSRLLLRAGWSEVACYEYCLRYYIQQAVHVPCIGAFPVKAAILPFSRSTRFNSKPPFHLTFGFTSNISFSVIFSHLVRLVCIFS